jgi:hypothetical protein
VIGALGNSEVREEPRTVLPLLDDLRRAWRCDDKAVAPAAQHFLYVFDAKEARRHELEHPRLLSVAERVELRIAAYLAASLVVRNFVFYPNSWSLGLGCRAFLPRLPLLLGRRRRAGLDTRHLRPLARRAENRLL